MLLFIDTNIFLYFYHFASDDLEELNKLTVLLQQGDVVLYLTEQVQDEFQRNRDSRIEDALKRLRQQRLNLQFPQLCKDYCEYHDLRRLQKEYEKLHSTLLEKLQADIESKALKADGIIQGLFRLAKKILLTDEVILKARSRSERGNPPGKKGSMRDAINWESLLWKVPSDGDLYFVTDDNDYCSPLNNLKPDSFLSSEWEKRKNSALLLYKTLSGFFCDKFPKIKLACEFEKELLIRKLASSHSFSQTHAVISKLSKCHDFTSAQLNDIVSAAISNDQISSIMEDADVKEFITQAIAGNETMIEKDSLTSLLQIIQNDIPSQAVYNGIDV